MGQYLELELNRRERHLSGKTIGSSQLSLSAFSRVWEMEGL